MYRVGAVFSAFGSGVTPIPREMLGARGSSSNGGPGVPSKSPSLLTTNLVTLCELLRPHTEDLIERFSEWDDDGITRKQFVLTVQLLGLEVPAGFARPPVTPSLSSSAPSRTLGLRLLTQATRL